MAYYAVQVVSGRELIVKNAIEIAVRNHRREDIKEVVVPSQIVLDLKKIGKGKHKANTVVAFSSYVFLNIETNNLQYHEMSGELFRFISSIQNVRKVLTQSLDQQEMESLLQVWNNPHTSQVMVFEIEQEVENLPEDMSMVRKAKEVIAKQKVISSFKRFVRTIMNNDKKSSGLRYEQVANGLIVYSPITLIMEALEQTRSTVKEFIKAPYELLHALIKVGYANENSCKAI
jgi:transcription antitermination factor NusG